MRFALIKNNVVLNVIEYDPANPLLIDGELLELSENDVVAPGYVITRDNKGVVSFAPMIDDYVPLYIGRIEGDNG